MNIIDNGSTSLQVRYKDDGIWTEHYIMVELDDDDFEIFKKNHDLNLLNELGIFIKSKSELFELKDGRPVLKEDEKSMTTDKGV